VPGAQLGMPAYKWPTDPTPKIVDFEKRHPNPEAGALLQWAVFCVESLHYLDDIDGEYEVTRQVFGNHHPDLVDLTHVRWGTTTSITALDLGVAALARALSGYGGPRELGVGDFNTTRKSKATIAVIRLMPLSAMQWIQGIALAPNYPVVNDVRHALTHRRLPRHLHMSAGSSSPAPRLGLSVYGVAVPAQELVQKARDLATVQISKLVALLPHL
jgi:hypothetical protein